ncbi:nitrilase-related carbon-nitrogen hydrolase [Aquisalimonas sp.]|uniref:nitrilase-related carbon-nitrogen hydrolase n=1 Tax=Aquisalimonas sp. TaxID=1872621 RepID=UPI0034513A61
MAVCEIAFRDYGRNPVRGRRIHLRTPLRQRDDWRAIQRAHVVANGLPVVVCNRVGFEPDRCSGELEAEFWGHSLLTGPQGRDYRRGRRRGQSRYRHHGPGTQRTRMPQQAVLEEQAHRCLRGSAQAVARFALRYQGQVGIGHVCRSVRRHQVPRRPSASTRSSHFWRPCGRFAPARPTKQ